MTRITALTSMVVAIVLASLLVVVGGSADAQPTRNALVSVSTAPVAPDGVFTTTVALDPGTTQMAAIAGALEFDDDSIEIAECSINGAFGACNQVDGELMFSMADIEGLESIEDLVTIDFIAPDGVEEIELGLIIDVAADVIGAKVDDIDIDHDEIVVVVAADGSLTGTIRDMIGELGVFGVDVCATNPNGDEVCVGTSGLGSYRIDDLIPGDYTLTISDPTGEFAPVTISAEVKSGEVTTGVDAALQSADDVEAETDGDGEDGETEEDSSEAIDEGGPAEASPGEISGTVRTSTGVAAFGMRVCAVRPVFNTEACVMSGLDGSFSIADLKPGNYVLTAVDRGGRHADSEARVVGLGSASGTAGVELQLG